MNALARLLRQVRHASRTSAHDRDLQAEMALHLEMKAEALRAGGASDVEAEAAARRAFGSVVASRERSRAAWGLLWWHDLRTDVRYGVRALWRSPRFAVGAIVTLALGIGANTAVFSVVHAVLLRPLPYPAPDRLVSLTGGQSLPDIIDVAAASRTLSSVGAWADWPLDGMEGGRPARVDAALVGGDLFRALGVPAHRGRTFDEQGNRAGQRVVVISHAYWRQQLGSREDAIGQSLRLNGTAYTIVAVMPPQFRLPTGRSMVWIPSRVGYPEAQDARGAHFMQAVARLADGVSIDAARAELAGIGAELTARHPEEARATYPVALLHGHLVRAVHAPLLVLMTGVSLVLLVACATFANLLLARTALRDGELRVRAALGAGRWRLARQLVTESVLLAALGGVVGASVAMAGVDLAALARPAGLPDVAVGGPDLTVLAWSLLLAVMTGVVFGGVPASRLWARAPGQASGARSTGRRALVRRTLVVAQVALAVVLLAGAVLLARSFLRLQQVPLGFEPQGAVTVRVTLPAERYESVEAQHAFVSRLTRALDELPGASRAGLVSELPLAGARIMHNMIIDGQPPIRPGDEPEIYAHEVSASGLEVLGIPLRDGRMFTSRDTAQAPLVGIVNERFVREQLGGSAAIGRRVRWARSEDVQWITIVGVAADARFEALDEPQPPTIYTPITQKLQAWKRWTGIVVRPVAGDSMTLVPAIDRAVWAIDPQLPVTEAQPMEALVADALNARRLQLVLMVLFALIALLLAVSGIYGVVSYLVAERARELGVRVALGATPRAVLGLVMREGVWLAGIGVGTGLLVSLAATGLLRAQLYGVDPIDPWSFAAATFALVTSALAAIALPARRAASMPAAQVLRSEH